MKFTPKEALKQLNDDRIGFLSQLMDGEVEFDEKYIHHKRRIAFHGWRPHIEEYWEISDGEHVLEMV